jgi:hypothetical protein
MSIIAQTPSAPHMHPNGTPRITAWHTHHSTQYNSFIVISSIWQRFFKIRTSWRKFELHRENLDLSEKIRTYCKTKFLCTHKFCFPCSHNWHPATNKKLSVPVGLVPSWIAQFPPALRSLMVCNLPTPLLGFPICP